MPFGSFVQNPQKQAIFPAREFPDVLTQLLKIPGPSGRGNLPFCHRIFQPTQILQGGVVRAERLEYKSFGE
jgi:hypothetical protein